MVVLFAGTIPTAVACFKMPQHRVYIGYEADLECLYVAKETARRQSAKAAFDAGMEIELSEEAAEAAARVIFSGTGVGDCGLIAISTRWAAAV